MDFGASNFIVAIESRVFAQYAYRIAFSVDSQRT
jgi:hypothetical protein